MHFRLHGKIGVVRHLQNVGRRCGANLLQDCQKKIALGPSAESGAPNF